MNPASLPRKISLGVALRAALLKLRWKRRRQLRKLLAAGSEADSTCPVCGSHRATIISFDRPGELVQKRFCRSCQHLYGEWDQRDLVSANIVFKFDEENEGSATQVKLLAEAATRSRCDHGVFLDFGVGGNVGAFKQASRLLPAHTFMACDIYPSEVEGYFETYASDAPTGIFDGIASYAVVEHLTNTFESWERFNRFLKPMDQGGGIMVHSFPSQLHLDFDDWAIQISTHVCLFSRRSLRLTCEHSGFQLLKADPPRFVGPHYHPVLVFRKVRDI